MLLVSVTASFSVSVHMFAAVLFVRTFLVKGLLVVALCLTIEGVDRQHRNSLAYLRNMLRPASQVLIAGLAYWLRDWRRLILVSVAPQLLLIVIFFFIAESPVWLASQPGRLSQLRQYAARANQINGGSATQADIDSLEVDESKSSSKSKAAALGLVAKLPRLRFITTNFLLLVFSGLSNSAILFNAEKLSGSFYLNFALLGVSNAVSYLLGWLLADRLGIVRLIRIDILLGAVAMATVAAVQTAGPELGLIVTVATQVGKIFLLNANNSVQIYGTQVFPTVARNLATGVIGVAVSLGSLLAPFLLYIGETGNSWLAFLPFLLIAGLLLCGLLLTLTLPPVPDRLLVTFEDFDSFLAAPAAGRQCCGVFYCGGAGPQVAPMEIPMAPTGGAGAQAAPNKL
ncbi:hypothetical protein BOX15_Mlig028548g2 [Macrostomum lignano]|uniref:Major facilitator superfamily (MFS) profile domain-containing protein n=1 Tax=Macrostomum lignano TaxID=282301 RepID=A0A267G661_9PLAT|nr:hypothetical protein BOX15_Mlig028548g2 [Macrostomum lignano]